MSEEKEKSMAAAQKKAGKKEEVTKSAKGQREKTVVYIGPTIKNVASTGSVYTNGLPERLKKEMEKQPAIGELLVPVEKLAEAKRSLAMPGSALAMIYKKVITE